MLMFLFSFCCSTPQLQEGCFLILSFLLLLICKRNDLGLIISAKIYWSF
jgi:hypothetical protein